MTIENTTPDIDFTKIDVSVISEAFKDKPETVAILSKALELAKFTAPIQATNKEFGTFKQNAATEIAGYKSQIAELEKKVTAPASGASAEADKNALELLKSEFESYKTTQTQKELAAIEAVNAANLKALDTDLVSTLISKAGGKAVDANAMVTLMKAQGLVGIEEGKHYFRKIVDGKPVTTTPDDLISSFLEANKYLAAASGVSGIGGSHNGTTVAGPRILTRAEAQAEFLKR